jgi:hypothetical protein
VLFSDIAKGGKEVYNTFKYGGRHAKGALISKMIGKGISLGVGATGTGKAIAQGIAKGTTGGDDSDAEKAGNFAKAAAIRGGGSALDTAAITYAFPGVSAKQAAASGAFWGAGTAAGEYGRMKGNALEKQGKSAQASATRIAGKTSDYALKANTFLPANAPVQARAVASGIGAAGGLGVGVGSEINKIKVGDSDVGGYVSRGVEAADKALGSPLTRGIRAQGAEDRAKMKAAMDKKRQQNTTVKPESALDRVRRRDLPAGYGVLKRPQ